MSTGQQKQRPTPLSASEILLVEDDPALAATLKEGLESEGYLVTWHTSGQGAIAYASDNHPHLILLDIRLPDISGLDVCREIRGLGLRLPIIMLTARAEEMDKVLGLEMGADDYVTKPFSLRELLARIRAQIRRVYGHLATADAEVLYAGSLTLDIGRAQVQSGNQIISLTPTEYRLLLYLVRHAGQALTRRQILEAVWGYGTGVDSERIVTVQVRRLREKVELDPSRPTLVLTVPGVGYRLAG